MRNMKIGKKIGVIISITLIIGLAILWFTISKKMSSAMWDSSVARLTEATESRASIVKQYFDSVDSFFVHFGQSYEVSNFLKNPTDEECKDIAFNYSDQYCATENRLEGLFVANLDTTVLYHTIHDVVGFTVREDEDSRNELISELFVQKGVYCRGVGESSMDEKQIITDYYPIYNDDDTPLGFVGGGIYIEDLAKQLENMELKGLNSSSYLLIDLNADSYIFSDQADLVGQQIEDEDYLELENQIKNNQQTDTATYQYKDSKTGKSTIAIYKTIPEKGWAFVLIDPEDDIYSSITNVKNSMLIVYLGILLSVMLVTGIMVYFISKDLVVVGKVTKEIGTLDLTNAKKLKRYGNRKDEIGMIAKATIALSNAVMDSMKLIKEKQTVLQETAVNLLETAKQTSESVTQVDSAIQEIAQGASSQATETEKATGTIVEIGNEIENTAQDSSTVRQNTNIILECSNVAMASLEQLSDINEEAMNSINVIFEQTNTTNQSALKIKEATSLITSISEETNLLSLNASIEAARAGEQGRGFAVVASQIQKLAEQSNNSAAQIDNIINSLISDSMKAVDTMGKINSIMGQQSECVDKTKKTFVDVKTKIDDLLDGIKQIAERINNIDENRNKMIDVVQGLSAIAEENAASAEETSASTSMVNEMTAQISDAASQLQEIANEIQHEVDVFTVE